MIAVERMGRSVMEDINRMRKVCGVGINDADYVVGKYESWYEGGKRKLKTLWQCPYYVKWHAMLNRCYNARYHKNKPTYIGCYVCEEWLTFSNFKAWM